MTWKAKLNPIPDYPSHDDDDVYDYFYVLEYDLTVDPPTTGRQNMDVVEENQMQNETRRQRRRRSATPDLTEGIGMQKKSGNPWINHVKAVAKKFNISYQEACIVWETVTNFFSQDLNTRKWA